MRPGRIKWHHQCSAASTGPCGAAAAACARAWSCCVTGGQALAQAAGVHQYPEQPPLGWSACLRWQEVACGCWWPWGVAVRQRSACRGTNHTHRHSSGCSSRHTLSSPWQRHAHPSPLPASRPEPAAVQEAHSGSPQLGEQLQRASEQKKPYIRRTSSSASRSSSSRRRLGLCPGSPSSSASSSS